MRRSMIVAGAGDAAARSSLLRHGKSHRAAGRQGGAGHERLDHEPLRSEPSAERRRRYPHLRDGESVELAQLVLRVEDRLRAAPYDQLAVGLDPGGGDLRLEIGLVDPARPEAPPDDDVRGGERRGGVAVPVVVSSGHVRRQLLLGQRFTRLSGRRVGAQAGCLPTLPPVAGQR